MSTALRQPVMTRDEFFAWTDAQEARYEFDGNVPVAMVRTSINHGLICQNLWRALRRRLESGPCIVLGPDAGLATVGEAVRYPDALVTCAKQSGRDYLVSGVLVVAEVLSPSSGRVDRIIKLMEYRAVPTILRYVILEQASIGASVFHRARAGQDWTAFPLTADQTLDLPEIGISIPMNELYDGVNLAADE